MCVSVSKNLRDTKWTVRLKLGYRHLRAHAVWGQGDGSVDEALTMKTWEPEFRSLAHMENPGGSHCPPAIPVPKRQRGLRKRPRLSRQNESAGRSPHVNRWSPHTHAAHTCAPAHTPQTDITHVKNIKLYELQTFYLHKTFQVTYNIGHVCTWNSQTQPCCKMKKLISQA